MNYYENSDDDNDDVDFDMSVENIINQDSLSHALIGFISNRTPIKYNSVNIAVGRKGSGKTYRFMKDIITISQDSPRTHLLVYVTRDKYSPDPTFETHK
jgi:hypothetical protein